MALADDSRNIPQWTRGDRLRKAREVAGLNQKDMAERFGVSRTTVGGWEDDAQPTKGITLMEMIDQWADITGVDAAWIAGFRIGSNRTPTLALIVDNDEPEDADDDWNPPTLIPA
jgi:transcriptional regulator with XRE-family HTH domain